MNSDPHEIAAWRAFGMLDSDEAAGFDEAMRQDPELRESFREMNVLCAAIAAASVTPLPPRAGQFERLQARLGLPSTKSVNWLGISGWAAAAAALAFILTVEQRQSPTPSEGAVNSSTLRTGNREAPIKPETGEQELVSQSSENTESEPIKDTATNQDVATQESDARMITKMETQHLVREIAVLREKLETVEKRERQRLEPVQGMAWPIVMTMRPPQATSQITPATDEDSSVVSALGDALAGRSPLVDNRMAKNVAEAPSAVPIYDPASGIGTLVANNLSDTNLWVIARGEDKPRLLGKIPQSTEAYESVGFDLPAGTIPSNFIITNDSDGKDAPPSDKNTVLIGPQ
jgi:flagellar motility protein MotE (MotC chaperone)